PSDDSFAGDTNDDGATTIITQPNSLRIGHGSTGTTINYTLFANAETAVSVGSGSRLSVTNSKFINNDKAFEVDPAGSYDLAIQYFWANLPCAPPYDSLVSVSNTWFGTGRIPGFPIGTETEIIRDEIEEPILRSFFDAMTDQYKDALNLRMRGNTSPWAVYSCKLVKFPVTPVAVLSIPLAEWLPQYKER
ncbi:hypothetical protein, partial [Arthrobacter oryzae]|uniref:hypothetical protein n=1 Tax=Arthrobacter oryzae TaxID=409290 RepID=UPI0016058585